MRRVVASASVLLACVSGAAAQAPNSAELLALVKSLQARVNVLERQAADRNVREPRRARIASPAVRVVTPTSGPVDFVALPRTAPWTGLYIGASAGLAVPTSSQTTRGNGIATGGAAPQAIAVYGQTTGTREPGALVGARAGFNVQVAPNLIGGIQAELGLNAVPLNQRGVANTTQSGGGIFFAATGSAFVQAHLVWDAAITGKLGMILTDRSMIYALAGPAYGQMQEGGTNLAIGMFGATAGAGLEYRLSENWSATGEYRYTYLRSGSYGASNFAITAQTFAPPAGQINTTQSRLQASIHQLRFGVNRHFTLD